MSSQPPPAWYSDPSDDDRWRYWDGSQWTEFTAPKIHGGAGGAPPLIESGATSTELAPRPPRANAAAERAKETEPSRLGRLFGKRTRAEQDAANEYRRVLDAMVAGEVALDGLAGRLRDTADAAGLGARKAAKVQERAFRATAQRMLQDDLLTADEEREFLEVADALGFTQADLESRFADLLADLVIAGANDGRLPEVFDPQLIAKRGEVVHLETAAALMKEVVHREYRGGGSGVSVPIGLGVRLRTGGFRGRSVVVGTSLEVADSGVLSVTDRRVVYQGQRKTQESRFDRLVGLEAFKDGVRIGVSNRQNASLYRVPNGPVVAAIISAAVQRA